MSSSWITRAGRFTLSGPKTRKPESTNDFEQHLAAINQAIATCTNCIAPDGTRQVLIFVHGGLNTYNQSLARVNEMTPEILAAHYYPLFVNWDSGLKSSYLEHLFLVRQGEVEPVWGPVTFPLYFVADVGRAVTRAPVVWYYQITSDFTTMVRYESPIRFGQAVPMPWRGPPPAPGPGSTFRSGATSARGGANAAISRPMSSPFPANWRRDRSLTPSARAPGTTCRDERRPCSGPRQNLSSQP